MLTAQQTAIISATVPILEQGGVALTHHFYLTLFRDYPEVQAIFNPANQANGKQQRALANAVLMYAKNIDRLEQLGPLVSTIINKHVSLQIERAHYPMVGASLLKAIREVLGAEVATDAVLDAWGAAYGQLADLLAGAEQALYDSNAAAPGGWRGARSFKVVEKTVESSEIVSLVLVAADGAAIVAHAPGQYIGLQLQIDGGEQRRQYSLSAAANGSSYRISVKREPSGVVSNYLHDEVDVGDSLQVFPPSGEFTLRDSTLPLVLISGGVGITPTLAMLTTALATGRPIRFIHAARNASVHAFRHHIDTLAAAHPQLQRYYCYETASSEGPQPHATGYLNGPLLASWLPETRDLDVYLLGPTPFMKAVKAQLLALGVPTSHTHYEFFGPAEALE